MIEMYNLKIVKSVLKFLRISGKECILEKSIDLQYFE